MTDDNPPIDDLLPDIGPPPDLPEVKDVLPDIKGPEPDRYEDIREELGDFGYERESDKFQQHEFIRTEQDRHRWQAAFNDESYRLFQTMAKDLADDFYMLHELRANYESHRGDLADGGL